MIIDTVTVSTDQVPRRPAQQSCFGILIVMLAYKFRPPEQAAYALDIILNNRLYCADWKTLNDPMEGKLSCGVPGPTEMFSEVCAETNRYKVCSLSATFNQHLLWGHYAGGFKGLAVEVEIDIFPPDVVMVDYRPDAYAAIENSPFSTAEETARYVLSSKYEAWQCEKEIRVLSRNTEWYGLKSPVQRVIVGHYMDTTLLDTFKIVCGHKKIELLQEQILPNGKIDTLRIPST